MSTDTDEIKFAYWVPNVSGGLVISKIQQRTHWDIDYNVKLAQTAEENGFEYALSQIRFTAGYGAESNTSPCPSVTGCSMPPTSSRFLPQFFPFVRELEARERLQFQAAE